MPASLPVRFVDENGRPYDADNPLPTSATLEAGTVNFDTTGLAAETTQAAGNTLLTAIRDAVQALQAIDYAIGSDFQGLATAANQDAMGVLLTAIRDALQTLDNAIAGNEMQVDVLTAPDARESWRISTLSFTTANDTNVDFTVPANTEYQILSVRASLVTTATVGDRQMALQWLDASDNILNEAVAPSVQTASLTRVYQWTPGMVQESDFVTIGSLVWLPMILPSVPLAAGQKLRVLDRAAIAAAADDLTIYVQVASRSVA